LYITGSGDAFGGPYFFRWLLGLRGEELPRLRGIHLHTNAQLWTPRRWRRLPPGIRAKIRSTEISIDAATAETYALNRRGGKWERLLSNLDFISELRKSGPLEYIKIHMVVQANNFREMPAFVRLGERWGVDSVYFSRLHDWETFEPAEYERRAVHLPSHPEHRAFVELLGTEELARSSVNLGNLTEFAPDAAGAHAEPRDRVQGELGRLIESMI
jgi:hypothetical protein